MLSVALINTKLKFHSGVEFPYWMGSAFRGGVGIFMKKAYCPGGIDDCQNCDINTRCIFFHTHMKCKSRRGESAPPKPIVLIPPFFGKKITIENNAFLDLKILIFGDFTKYLPHLVLALRMLGKEGIGDMRHLGLNRFTVSEMRCGISGNKVFDGECLNLDNLQSIEIKEISPLENSDSIRVGFLTPFISKSNSFPPNLDRLIWHIRHRLIFFVNEYGTGEKVPDFSAEGNIRDAVVHFHRLNRRSQRGGRQEFDSHTGIVAYDIKNMDEHARWLLSVGEIIGAGPKPSFGCGWISIMEKH